jgi:hypothetical protein
MVNSLLMAALLVVATGNSREWPQWRGPNRDATTANAAPSAWPATLVQRWRQEVGAGQSRPVVSGETVFLFSRESETETARALDLHTGKTLCGRGTRRRIPSTRVRFRTAAVPSPRRSCTRAASSRWASAASSPPSIRATDASSGRTRLPAASRPRLPLSGRRCLRSSWRTARRARRRAPGRRAPRARSRDRRREVEARRRRSELLLPHPDVLLGSGAARRPGPSKDPRHRPCRGQDPLEPSLRHPLRPEHRDAAARRGSARRLEPGDRNPGHPPLPHERRVDA